jgi:tryptophan-rich sensory protein
MIKLIIAILIPLIIGAVSGFFTSEAVTGWYAAIQKPSFNPPNGIFAPVWTTLYIMMGIALYLVWKQERNTKIWRQALFLFGLQLFLNFCWSLIFFKLEQPGWALVEMVCLWISILLTIIWFSKLSKVSAWLLVPYICWVSFAALLNYEIWRLN